MDGDNRLGEFLSARRRLTDPAGVGLPSAGRRRVPGLRREEVALLAGVSADYYVRLEQGRDRHPSDQVVDALARVFELDEDATAHLRELARPRSRRRRNPVRPERVGPGLHRLLARWTDTPAFVAGRYLDVLAANALVTALSPSTAVGANLVRALFLEPEAQCLYSQWDAVARDTVASLRAAAGADLDHPRLTELVGELSLKSEEFRRLWARHDVREKSSGSKQFIHPMVGELTLGYETFAVQGTSGQQLVVYHAEPGSPSERALALLGSMAASAPTPAPDDAAGTASERQPSDTGQKTSVHGH